MDKTEMLSFLDSDVVYSETKVPEAIVDLEVRNGNLIAHKANDVEFDVGSWFGKSGVQIKSMSLTQNDELLTILSDNTEVLTPRTKWDVSIPSRLKGKGQLQPPVAFPHLFNDAPTDFYDEDNDLLYMFGKAPKYVSLTTLRMVTVTGVTVTASNQWSAAYPIYSIFNRKVEFVSDGLLGSGALTVTFEFPLDKPAEIKGYLYQNLRADYTTHSYIIEYLPPGGTVWQPLDTRSPGMALNTVIYAESVIAKSIRWRSLTFGSAPGVGRLDWLVGKAGNSAGAQPVNFPSGYFNVTEDEDTIYVEPNRLTPTDNTDVRFNLLNYHHLMCVPTGGQRTLFKANMLNVVPWNVVRADSTDAADELPLIKLKRGRWYYRYALVLVNTGKFRIFLSIGGTLYPLSDIMSGVTQLTYSRAVVAQDEGIIEIHEDTTTFLVVEQEGAGGLSKVGVGSHSASLELWWLDDNLTPVIAPVLPSIGLIPAPFKHLEGTLAVGNGSALFTDSLANESRWASAANYLVMSVTTHFRIWRCTLAAGGPLNARLKVTKLDRGAYVMENVHKVLTKVGGNEWEVMTYTLPPGIYRFDYIAERKDSAWFIEQMPKPAEWEFGQVAIRVTLPMTSAVEAGQTVTNSSEANGSTKGFNAFTAVPTGNGWLSGGATIFGDGVNRVNLPMTATPQSGQTATWSSDYGAAYSGLEALGVGISANGWVVSAAPTPAAPQWLQLKFDTPVAFDSYSITNRNYSLAISPRSWTVQVSDNGVDWTPVSTVVDDMRDNQAELRVFRLDTPVTAKFVRLSITKHHAFSGVPYLCAVGQFLIGTMTSKSEWLNVAFDAAQRIVKYQLTNRLAANDNTTHSPKSWQLLGRLAGGEWEVLHTVVGDTRNSYGLTREFFLDTPAICDEVRLNITAKNNGTGAEATNPYVIVQHFQLSNVVNTLNSDWL